MTDGGEGMPNPSKETRDKLSRASSKNMSINNHMRGKVVSQEIRNKISISISKFKTGRSLPISHKKNIAKSKQKKVLNITTGEIYESLLDCALKNGMPYHRIANILRERIKPKGLYIKIYT